MDIQKPNSIKTTKNNKPNSKNSIKPAKKSSIKNNKPTLKNSIKTAKKSSIKNNKPTPKNSIKTAKKSSIKHNKLTPKNSIKTAKNSSIKNIKEKDLCKDIIFMDNVHTNYLCHTSYKSKINNNIKPIEKENQITRYKDDLLSILNTTSDEYSVFFTSDEIESNNLILSTCINAYKKIRKIKPHVVISSVESDSIIKHANSLKDSNQIELSIIQSNSYGCILSQNIDKYAKDNTCLFMISYINSKIGSVNNINKISNILHEKKIPLHSDCSFLLGNHNLDLSNNTIDSITLSFDKINAPLGLGAVIIRNQLLDGYKLKEHSVILDNKKNIDLGLIETAINLLKNKLKDRKKKNLKLLKYRNQIINSIGKKCQILTFANFMKSDEPPLDEDKHKLNKLVILGPPIDNNSYYTPSILSFIIINDKKRDNIYIKEELEKNNIIIGIPSYNISDIDDFSNDHNTSNKKDFYDNIGIPIDAKKYIINISINDNLSQNNIDYFINKLYKIIY